jgi:HPt (histidine-containing phosphotransfer) domain-containing protein
MTDCQMPGMDGYDLTMAIRYAEIDGERRTAIVGVSASVMASDVEKSLMSGMDEFVTKPVSLDRLGEVLARALPAPDDGSATAPTAMGVEPPAIGAGGAAIDMTVLERIGRNNPDLLRELLTEFCDVTRDTVAAIESATAMGDAYEAGALAHRLVGAAATAGAHELAEAGRRVEAAGDTGNVDAVRRHLHALKVAMVRVIDEIAAGRPA